MKTNLLKNKKVLITSGPTRVYLDPVRFISNSSSGRMGKAFAEAVLSLGAEVMIISGPSAILYPKKAKNIKIETNKEMYNALKKWFNWADIFISAAAVVDFKPVKYNKEKIKKKDEFFILKLVPSKDLLKTFAKNKRKNQCIVGFALETSDVLKNAEKKLREKKIDFIIANKPDKSVNLKEAEVTLLHKSGYIKKFKNMPKVKLAKKIIREIVQDNICQKK